LHWFLPAPGSFVWIRRWRWRVDRARRSGPLVRLDVTGPAGEATFLSPFDRPAEAWWRTRPVRKRRQHARAAVFRIVSGSFTTRTLRSAVHARIALLPYQLEPALAATHGTRRMLIADEVGLGKTIQAGLVLAELVARAPSVRALIIVPSGLRDEWADELRRRFGIRCTLADHATLDELSRERAWGDNPWLRAGAWIVSLDYLKQPHVRAALPPLPWDLVVVDEAHHAAGDSDRHDVAHAIGQRALRLLLLSATPHSGDEVRFARLMNLGAIGGSNDAMAVFRRTRETTGLESRRRVSWVHVKPSNAEARFLEALEHFEHVTLQAADSSKHRGALLLLSVFRKRALSTAAAARSTLRQRLAWLQQSAIPQGRDGTQLGFDFEDADELADDERTALTVDAGLGPEDERGHLERLIALASRAARIESKVARLVRLVDRTGDRAIVFTEFRTSLEVLLHHAPAAWRVAALHGGMSSQERTASLARFREGHARVLLATDVAGQGLNLQHAARWVLSLEIPWNPARLEQRLGRVDRIGQARPAHLSVFVARHEAENGLLAHLARRTLAARRALGSDALPAASLSEAQLAAALLAGRVPPEAAVREAPVALELGWTRHARVQARLLTRLRALASRWQAGAAPSPCISARVPWSQLRNAGGSRGALLVFEVSIFDEQNSVVETHPIVVSVPAAREVGDLAPGMRLAAEQCACRRLEPRLRRLVRIRRLLAATELATMARLEDLLVADLSASEVQPGLFDRRALAALDTAASRRALLDRHVEGLSSRLGGAVRTGRPVLRAVLLPDGP